MTFKEALTSLDGYWEYNGGKYLALLTSGKISDVFCNTGVITTYPARLCAWSKVLADQLVKRLDTRNIQMNAVNVIGPGMGGITLAYEVASHLGMIKQILTKSYFTEPYDESITSQDGSTMVLKKHRFRFDLPTDTPVILCEDVITTGGSVQKTLSAVWKEGLNVLPIVVCLVDRRCDKSPIVLTTPSGTITADVISLLEIKPKAWDVIEEAKKVYPNVIEAIKPKANWNKLTGK